MVKATKSVFPASVSATVLASLFGISTRAVTDLAKRGIVVRAGTGYALEASVRGYCEHLRKLATGRGEASVATTAAQERAKLARVQADKIELQNDAARGSLLDAAAVQAEWSDTLRQVRAGMLAVPSRSAARLPHLTAHDVSEIDQEVRAGADRGRRRVICPAMANAYGICARSVYRRDACPGSPKLRAAALRSLIPPPRLKLSEWIESNLRLPEGVSALPGAIRLYPYQRGIADAISDPLIEKVTLVKGVRIGFTTLLTSAIGSFIANEPAPILCLLPTEADARDYMVSDIEPTFQAMPALRGTLAADVSDDGERNTLLHRRFPGGSLKVVAARAPRNLRRHTAKSC